MWGQPSIYTQKESICKIKVHTDVQGAEIATLLGRLPTLWVLAGTHYKHTGLVLTEIETLSRMNFLSNCLLKVGIRNNTVLVPIKSFKNLAQGLFSHVYAPVIEIKLEFLRVHLPTRLLIDVMKWFSNGFPLILNLLKDYFHGLFLGYHVFCNFTSEKSNSTLITMLILLKCWIFFRVMSEIKPLNWVNKVADPLGKILIG